MDGHSSGAAVARNLVQSTREAGRRRPWENPRFPYTTLLLVGLAMPPSLPEARWALTPPFHPCRAETRWTSLCGAFPEVALAERYPAPCLRGARTLLTRVLSHPGATIQPSAPVI